MLHRLTRAYSRAARVCQHGQPAAVLVRAARRSSRSAIAASSCSVVVAVAAGTTVAACDAPFDESPRDAYGGITVVVRETDDFEAALTASLGR